MNEFEFSDIQNINFKNLSKAASYAYAAFGLYGILNLVGLAGPVGRAFLLTHPFITAANIVVLATCCLCALAFKRASDNYSQIINSEGRDIELNANAGMQLQKAFTWAAVAIALMIARSINFQATFDMVPR
jgi:hypothetical protein